MAYLPPAELKVSHGDKWELCFLEKSDSFMSVLFHTDKSLQTQQTNKQECRKNITCPVSIGHVNDFQFCS